MVIGDKVIYDKASTPTYRRRTGIVVDCQTLNGKHRSRVHWTYDWYRKEKLNVKTWVSDIYLSKI